MYETSFISKIQKFISEQKYILILIVIVLCAGIFLFFFIRSVQNKTTVTNGIPFANQAASGAGQKNSSSLVSKIATILFHSNNQNIQNESSGSGQSSQSTQGNSGSTINSGAGNSTTVSQTPGQTSTGNGNTNAQNTNGSSNAIGDQTPQNSQSNNPNQTNFQIVFQGPDGSDTYTPPVTPPVQVTWATYTDDTYHYSIQYPANWQIVNGQTAFSKGLTLFLPGEDTTDISQKYIAFGWSNYNLFPAIALNDDGSTTSPAIVTGVTGTIYTKGPMGLSYIVSIYPYENGYFGLITYSSDSTIAYIYQYMMESLTFNIQ